MAGDSAGMVVTLALMFFGALGAGYLPYFLTVRESRLQIMSVLGGGLLIGSALGIVIPEGMAAFHEIGGGDVHDDHSHHAEHDHGSEGPAHGLTGLALIFGFLTMMLLDQLQGGDHHHHNHRHHSHSTADDECEASNTNTGELKKAASSELNLLAIDSEQGAVSGHVISTGKGAKSTTGTGTTSADRAVMGLLVHCASDGLALGSAFLSGNAALSFVVGTAMVLHKAPMALGLSTYLQSCKWPWARAQRTLIIFAATAPISSVITYTVLRAVPMLTTPTAISLAILFSGGTFLQAATMHILPEILSSGGNRFSKEQLIAVAVGSILPVLLSWGHHH